MTTRKIAQKIPFKPTKKQVMFFADCFGARRFAYNSQVAVFNTYLARSSGKTHLIRHFGVLGIFEYMGDK